MLAVYTLPDPVLKRPNLFIIKSEPVVMKYFLVWKNYFTFLYRWLIALFCKNNFMEI